MAEPPPPPPLQLGPLPYDLAASILLRLSPVERILAESTCKGWLALLRAPELWAELDVDAALADLTACGFDTEYGFLDLREHAGASLRSVHAASNVLWPDVFTAIGEHCLQLERLRMPKYVADELQSADELVTIVAQLPRLHELDLGTLCLSLHDNDELVRSVLESQLPHASATLQLCDVFTQVDDQEDFGVAQLGRVAAVLTRCVWRRIAIDMTRTNGHVDRIQLATMLRGFVEALQNALVVPCISVHDTLGADEARWVTRAVPTHLCIDAWHVDCTAADAGFLGEAFRPGVVVRGELSLSGPPWPAHAVQTAVNALSACADGAAAAGRRAEFSLKLDLHEGEPWPAAAFGPLGVWMRSGADVISLDVGDDALLPLLLPALPDSLQQLLLSRCAMEHDTFAALLLWLRKGEFPALKRVDFVLNSAADARLLIAALAASPRDTMEVRYRLEGSSVDHIACHLALLCAPFICLGTEVTGPAQCLLNLFRIMTTDTWQGSLEDGGLTTIIAALHTAAAAVSRGKCNQPVGPLAHLLFFRRARAVAATMLRRWQRSRCKVRRPRYPCYAPRSRTRAPPASA
jgi:hypothetical protein